jgi:hypothetical protein
VPPLHSLAPPDNYVCVTLVPPKACPVLPQQRADILHARGKLQLLR